MARIPNEELERLKREVSVERLAEAHGVKLAKRGKDLVGLCPFHEDREPSLVVTPKKNLWHCLGACQAGGGPIDWVMRVEGVSFRHAVELLRRDLGGGPIALGRVAHARRASKSEKLDRLAEPDEADEIVLERVMSYYHATLKESPEALGYMKSRGLEHPEVIDAFGLGYANRTLAYRLPTKKTKTGAALRAQLSRLGVMRESGHEHLNGSLVVPLHDAHGRVVGMYGRKVGSVLRPGTPMHLYLPGPHRGVFNRAAITVSREVILCEALIDALTFWCAGQRHVTSAYGTEGFTKELYQALVERGVSKVLIAFDRDTAGERAAERVAKELVAGGMSAWRVLFPNGMDANEYARKVTPANKSLELAVRQAQWMGGARSVAVPAELDSRSNTSDRAPKNGSYSEQTTAERDGDAPAKRDRAVASRDRDKGAAYDALEATIGEAAELLASTSDGAAEAPDSLAAALDAMVAERDHGPEPSPLAAHSSPTSLASDEPRPAVEVKDEEVVIALGDRHWRIRGLGKNLSYEQLRVNVLVRREGAERARGSGFFVDTLELYSARQRGAFVKQAAEELGVDERVVKRDLGRLLAELEALQDTAIRKKLEPEPEGTVMSDEERAEALALLRDPRLLDRIVEDLGETGIVGEQVNKLVGYLGVTSRKLDEPLAVVLQSSSAAGKSSLMEAVLGFVPEEERVLYSAMTGQSLFYMGETDLSHKVLAVAEEEGARSASYALKLLQSEGELTIASTGKDPSTGRLVTHEYRVKGPVMLFLTTTAIEVDEELQNRCLVLSVDEGRAQTRAIHERQRAGQTLEGQLARRARGRLRKLHQNAQRLIRPLVVVNPFASALGFSDTRTRTRRDHMKYLTLIRTIALLHQHQRPVRVVEHRGEQVEYVEVTAEDVRIANRLCHDVLGRSLDTLSPPTRALLEAVHRMVTARARETGVDVEDFRFSRREVREHTGMGHTQLTVHMGRLEELEYLVVHRGGRGRAMVYELAYRGEGEDGGRFVPGLVEPETRQYDTNLSGQNGGLSVSEPNLLGSNRPQVGPKSGGGRGANFDGEPKHPAHLRAVNANEPEKGQLRRDEKPDQSQSYAHASDASTTTSTRAIAARDERDDDATTSASRARTARALTS